MVDGNSSLAVRTRAYNAPQLDYGRIPSFLRSSWPFRHRLLFPTVSTISWGFELAMFKLSRMIDQIGYHISHPVFIRRSGYLECVEYPVRRDMG